MLSPFPNFTLMILYLPFSSEFLHVLLNEYPINSRLNISIDMGHNKKVQLARICLESRLLQ